MPRVRSSEVFNDDQEEDNDDDDEDDTDRSNEYYLSSGDDDDSLVGIDGSDPSIISNVSSSTISGMRILITSIIVNITRSFEWRLMVNKNT